MATVLSALVMRIDPPVGAKMLPAFSGNQCPRKAPVSIAGGKRALGLLEGTDLHVAEPQPLEQRRQVHARERLHERLVIAPRVAEMDERIEWIRSRQEVE